MASENPNNVVALPDGTRHLPLRLASCPAGSGADSRRDKGTFQDRYGTPKALARGSTFDVAMLKSRSGEQRARRKNITGEASRPLMAMDTSPADVVHIAQGGPEPSNQHEVLSHVLRNELHDALRLMKHRER